MVRRNVHAVPARAHDASASDVGEGAEKPAAARALQAFLFPATACRLRVAPATR
jgi:hypothetical protein